MVRATSSRRQSALVLRVEIGLTHVVGREKLGEKPGGQEQSSLRGQQLCWAAVKGVCKCGEGRGRTSTLRVFVL